MAELPERETSSIAIWARAVARFAVVLFMTAAVGHRYGLVETLAFFWILGIVASLAILALCLAAGGFVALWSRGHRAGRASLTATILAALVLAPFALAAYDAVRLPPLYDIATDTMEPPQFRVAQRLRTRAMNPIAPITQDMADLQLAAYPDLTGRRFEASLERVLSATRAVIEERGWTFHSQVGEPDAAGELTIELFAPTFLLRYPVDAVVRLSDEGESTFVDMRMNSRYGRHDVGDGARRIRSFMADLEKEFERQSLQIIDIPESSEDEGSVD